MGVMQDLIQQMKRRRVRVEGKRIVVVCYGKEGMNVGVVGCGVLWKRIYECGCCGLCL